MKALVLGCGSIGLRHIGHLRELGLSDVEAADVSPEACERAHQAHRVRTYTDPARALDRRPDVVLVCTPASTHVPVALEALRAGAHVFVEKPLSVSLEGLDRLVQAARADGRVVQVGYHLRFHTAHRKVKEILDGGRLGRVLAAHAEFGLYLGKWWPGRDYRASYMATTRMGGGLLLDVSHEIDLLRWLLGEVVEVSAYGGKLSRLEMEGWDTLRVLMKTAGGALATLHMDCLQPIYTRGFSLTGEDSGLRWSCVGEPADRTVGLLEICEPGKERYEPVPLKEETAGPYVEELRAFLASVEGGAPPEVNLEAGVEVLRIIDAIGRSVQWGRSVRIGA